MGRSRLALTVMALFSTVAASCGDAADIDATTSSLQSFGVWSSLPGAVASGVASSSPGATRLFIRGTDGRIRTAGSINDTFDGWTTLTNNPPIEGKPAACRILFADHVNGVGGSDLHVIVARHSDGQYYLRMQAFDSGSIIQDWIGVPRGVFSSAPAIICGVSSLGVTRTLVLVGRGLDNRFYAATNTLEPVAAGSRSVTFANTAWTAFSRIGTQAFVGDPALTSTGCSTAPFVHTGAHALALMLRRQKMG